MVYRNLPRISNLNLSLVVRAGGNPARLAESIRREVRAVDPTSRSTRWTMNTVVSAALAQRRFTTLLLSLFAATALMLSCDQHLRGDGISFVGQRTHGIGIRVALRRSAADAAPRARSGRAACCVGRGRRDLPVPSRSRGPLKDCCAASARAARSRSSFSRRPVQLSRSPPATSPRAARPRRSDHGIAIRIGESRAGGSRACLPDAVEGLGPRAPRVPAATSSSSPPP